ncbi:hypothetical protein PENPOL_c003G09938 [Penicillium polonicum]|uniref:Uncharacterized protein n=1 Tax=Penicillium polonicum TaxID=60169 RepID=A0A1V6NT69_PENPO|nr:hypothetical protein PENPOL_c003G09938 [Penicillium polonicum]
MPIGRRDDNAETVLAELVQLAEQKCAAVMNSDEQRGEQAHLDNCHILMVVAHNVVGRFQYQ